MNLLFKTTLFIFFLFFTIDTKGQIDTSKLQLQVLELKSLEDHIEFWRKLNQRDQKFRNINTSHLIDFENLLSASYYLNEFGYPSESNAIGRRTISLIWSHSSLPQVKQEAFPLIHCGLITGHLSEQIIRVYYLRNFYWFRYFDHSNRTKDFELFLSDLGVQKGCKIDINKLVRLYSESMQFLHQDWNIIGRWKCPRQSSPIQILKSEQEIYYYQIVYSDSSFYPLNVIQDEVDLLNFKNIYKPSFYFKILGDGRLEMNDITGTKNCKQLNDFD